MAWEAGQSQPSATRRPHTPYADPFAEEAPSVYTRDGVDRLAEDAPYASRSAFSGAGGAAFGPSLVGGGGELRTVPSAAFPTIASALPTPGEAKGSAVPSIVVSILPGVYQERLRITAPCTLVGAEGGKTTLLAVGADGVAVVGTGDGACVLRRLRICAEAGGHALRIGSRASPLVESCELLGAGGAPTRGAPAGVDVRGEGACPVLRDCRITGHAGAGVCFGDNAGGMLITSEVSRCGCGVWLEAGANPLVWRNTIAGHRGAGIVVRADGMGRVIGNTVIRNGAGGMLVESARRAVVVIGQNRIWANVGGDLRQSPAPPGRPASEVGTLLLRNIAGEARGGAGLEASELRSAWPRRTVSTAWDLAAALREAPRDRIALIELVGRVELGTPLVLDRPVVLAGASDSAEICGPPGAEAAIVVAAGGEAAALWRLRVSLLAPTRAGAACVSILAGQPVLADCELDASGEERLGRATSQASRTPRAQTHAVHVAGAGTAALLSGCALRGAAGAGLLLDRGGAATLLQCELSGHRGGGAFVGRAAALTLEGCEVARNGHFGIVVGPRAGRLYAGRTTLTSNAAGSLWHCGSGGSGGCGGSDEDDMSPHGGAKLVVLDQCALSCGGQRDRGGAAPAVVVGSGAEAFLWDAAFEPRPRGCNAPRVRCEAAARAVVASLEPPALVGNGLHRQHGAASTMSGREEKAQAPARGLEAGGALWLDASGPPQGAVAVAAWAPAAPTALALGDRPWEAGRGTPDWHVDESPLRQTRIQGFGPPSRRPSEAPYRAQLAARLPLAPPSPPRQPQPATTNGHAEAAWGATGPGAAAGGGAYELPIQSRRGAADEAAAAEQAEWEAALAASAAAEAEAAQAAGASSGFPSGFGEGQRMGGEAPAEGFGSWAGFQSQAPKAEADAAECMAWLLGKHEEERTIRCTGAVEAPGEPWDLRSRRLLYSILLSFARADKCEDALDGAGLGGEIQAGNEVLLRGHTNRLLGVRGEDIVCNQPDRAKAATFAIEMAKGRSLKHGSKVSLRLVDESGGSVRVVVGPDQALLAKKKSEKDAEALFVVERDGEGVVMSGMLVYLKSHSTGNLVDIEGEDVRARTRYRGTLQRIAIEKLLSEAEVPGPCADLQLSLEQKIWAFRRGVQHALVDPQALAAYLAGHKPGRKELLQAYTSRWEAEWRSAWPQLLGAEGAGGAELDGSPSSAGSDRSGKRAGQKKGRMGWLTGARDNGKSAEQRDRENGDLFVGAMRSFFAGAVRMSQLEADPVQRVVEAFADALIADKAFFTNFTPSMLPEMERTTYAKPEDVLFGLTYMTIMLNTDMHNKQVSHKMWDLKKFAGAGKDCGVTPGLMTQVFKNVEKEEM